jgi:hypothetical protein
MRPCPGHDDLRRLLAEQLAEGEREVAERHVEGCAACQEVLAALAGDAPPGVADCPDRPPLGTGMRRRLERAGRAPPRPTAVPLRMAPGRAFPGTRSSRSWAAAAWASSTGPATWPWTARWP